MTLVRTILAACLMVLSSAASAPAATPWPTPLTLGPPSNGSQAIGLSFSPRGEGMFGWTIGQASYVAPLRGDGTLGAPTRLPTTLVAGPALAPTPPLPAERQRAIVILRRQLPSPPSGATTTPVDRSRLSWALVRADGTLGKVRTLSTRSA